MLWKDKNSTFVLGKREFQLLLVNGVDYSEAVAPRLVGRSRHDASPIRRSTHNDWLAAVIGVVPLLDAGVEGVQVDMQDRSYSFVHVPHGLSTVYVRLRFQLYQHRG